MLSWTFGGAEVQEGGVKGRGGGEKNRRSELNIGGRGDQELII